MGATEDLIMTWLPLKTFWWHGCHWRSYDHVAVLEDLIVMTIWSAVGGCHWRPYNHQARIQDCSEGGGGGTWWPQGGGGDRGWSPGEKLLLEHTTFSATRGGVIYPVTTPLDPPLKTLRPCGCHWWPYDHVAATEDLTTMWLLLKTLRPCGCYWRPYDHVAATEDLTTMWLLVIFMRLLQVQTSSYQDLDFNEIFAGTRFPSGCMFREIHSSFVWGVCSLDLWPVWRHQSCRFPTAPVPVLPSRIVCANIIIMFMLELWCVGQSYSRQWPQDFIALPFSPHRKCILNSFMNICCNGTLS